jgi:hypothetical protein
MKEQIDVERPYKDRTSAVPSSPRNLPVNPTSTVRSRSSAIVDPVLLGKASSNVTQQTDKAAPSITSSPFTGVPKHEIQKAASPKPTEKAVAQQLPVISRPSSAPLVPGPRPTAPVVSMVQTAPLLARSVSAAGRLGPEPSPATHGYVPQSYRNAIVGNPVASSTGGFTHPNSQSSGLSQSSAFSQSATLVSAPMFLSQSSERIDPNTVKTGIPYGMVMRDVLQNGSHWIGTSHRETSRNVHYDPSSLLNDVQNLGLYRTGHGESWEQLSSKFPASISGRQNQGVLGEEFPHLDIINDLLDDEHGVGKASRASTVSQTLSNGPQLLNRQFSFPGDMGMSADVGSSSSPCRFERTRSYHEDGFQPHYHSAGSHYDSTRDFIPQASALPYVNGQVDGLIPNQWQLAGSDLSVLGMRNMEGDGYPHYNPDYSNLACGVNGYIYSFSAIKWALKGKYDGVCPQISGFLLVVIMYLRKLLVLDFE